MRAFSVFIIAAFLLPALNPLCASARAQGEVCELSEGHATKACHIESVPEKEHGHEACSIGGSGDESVHTDPRVLSCGCRGKGKNNLRISEDPFICGSIPVPAPTVTGFHPLSPAIPCNDPFVKDNQKPPSLV